MRIFVHDHSGQGFQVELSRALAGAGHHVRHASCSSCSTPHGALEVWPGDPVGFSVVGIDHDEPFDEHHLRHRTRQELRYVSLFAGEVRAFAPDIVVSADAPPFTRRGISRWCRTVGLPQILWLQDVSSAAMGRQARRRLGPGGAVAARAFAGMESAACRDAAAVVVTTAEDLGPFLHRAGVDGHRITVIDDHGPLAEVTEQFQAVIDHVVEPELVDARP